MEKVTLATMYGNRYSNENVKQTWGIFRSKESAEDILREGDYEKREGGSYQDEWVSDCLDWKVYLKEVYLDEILT